MAAWTRRDSVARTKDGSLAERNRRICLLRRNGFTYSDIADMEGVSRVRVAQIVAETNAELGEDDGRAEIASILEYAERKCVELINSPGFVAGPNGRVVTDGDGTPLENKGIVGDALKTLMVIEDRKAKLFGWDKQRQRETPVDEARRQMEGLLELARQQKALEDAARELSATERRELEMFRQQAAPVPGEVLKELPPGEVSS